MVRLVSLLDNSRNDANEVINGEADEDFEELLAKPMQDVAIANEPLTKNVIDDHFAMVCSCFCSYFCRLIPMCASG